ncbi:hypothetical protein [Agriterribacter sp.]|uniref:hypothetical protein n=1 Tax=Agriterribacter sp. TaxID=2821509 RepID=UPI002CFF508C|nr:hypothetical protein [Agriterribacter sp.]HTN08717.1 hypothetical protein [Agriterribacter sp.]
MRLFGKGWLYFQSTAVYNYSFAGEMADYAGTPGITAATYLQAIAGVCLGLGFFSFCGYDFVSDVLYLFVHIYIIPYKGLSPSEMEIIFTSFLCDEKIIE